MKQARQLFRSLTKPAAAVFFSLVVGGLFIYWAGEPVITSFIELFNGAFGSRANLAATLTRSAPIILTGVGLSVAFSAGHFNLGAEGQLVFGGLASALTAIYFPFAVPGPVLMILALLAGAAAGGLWSALAGWMDARHGVRLLLSTLLMNYVAVYFASWVVTDPLRDRTGRSALAQTERIPTVAEFPKVFEGTRFHWGFILVVLAVVAVAVLMRKTVRGYEFRLTGLNARFAEYAGINRVRGMITTMLISGLIVGFAGGIEILGVHHRYIDGNLHNPGYAWTGLVAALLAGSHPVGTAFAGFVLAAIETGAIGLQRSTDVPLSLANIIQGTIILFVSVRVGVDWWQGRTAGSKKAEADGL